MLSLAITSKALSFPSSYLDYVASDSGRNTRLLFETFAQSRGLDPLVAETWYSIPRLSIFDIRVGPRNTKNKQKTYKTQCELTSNFFAGNEIPRPSVKWKLGEDA